MKESALKKIKMVIMDVDGVLSDGRIILDSRGGENKVFNVYDGAGIAYLHYAGIKTGIITGRTSRTVTYRARELGILDVHQNTLEKLNALKKILARHKLSPGEICYIGDDLPDIPVMKKAGFAVATNNASPEVRKYAHYVTRLNGGKGAVREVAEKILKAQNKWKTVISRYDHNA